jgi:hypothetical protein
MSDTRDPRLEPRPMAPLGQGRGGGEHGGWEQMSETPIRPFSCGTQFLDWQDANCCRCKKYSYQTDPATGKTREPLDVSEVCPVELALCESAYGDGTVSQEIGRRMGFTDPLAYSWPCGEVDWTEEWKAEYARRHAALPEARP